MLPMPGNGGGGLRFSLFGFPVRIHLWFLIVAGIIGVSGPEPSVGRAVVWIAVVLVSVLVHELGHAFAARTIGAEPTIDLYALGGLTAFSPPRPMGRWQSVGISLAGPFAGFLLGFLILSGAAALGMDRSGPFVTTDAPIVEVIVGASIWVNLYWGVVNLLPILPLDGGNVVRSLLPGADDHRRDRLATAVSLGMAVVIVIGLLRYGLEELILLPLLLGALNLQALISDARQPAGVSGEDVMAALSSLERGDAGALRSVSELAIAAPPELRDRLKVTAIEVLLRTGRVQDARDALVHLAGGAHPSLYALVDAVDGDAHALGMLDDMVRAQPLPSIARYALLGRVLTQRGADVPHAFLAFPPPAQAPGQLREMQYLAHLRGDYVGSAAIGELQLQFGPPDAWVLYNTACSWSRAGDRDRALLRLGQAVDAGWSDAAQLDTDQDLAPLWISDRFREIRRRLAGPAPAAF